MGATVWLARRRPECQLDAAGAELGVAGVCDPPRNEDVNILRKNQASTSIFVQNPNQNFSL